MKGVVDYDDTYHSVVVANLLLLLSFSIPLPLRIAEARRVTGRGFLVSRDGYQYSTAIILLLL